MLLFRFLYFTQSGAARLEDLLLVPSQLPSHLYLKCIFTT